jgi:hypothetical protein
MLAGWSLVISSLLLRWIQNGMERKIEFIPKVMKACSGRQIDFSLKVQQLELMHVSTCFFRFHSLLHHEYIVFQVIPVMTIE